MALFRIVSEIQWDIGWNSQIFDNPPLFGAPVGSDFAGISVTVWSPVGKLEWWGHAPGDEKSLILSLALSIQYTLHQRDGRTDGRTPADSKDHAMLLYSFAR